MYIQSSYTWDTLVPGIGKSCKFQRASSESFLTSEMKLYFMKRVNAILIFHESSIFFNFTILCID